MENKKILVALVLIIIMLFYGFNLVKKNEVSLTGWILIFLSAIIFLIILNRYETKRINK